MSEELNRPFVLTATIYTTSLPEPFVRAAAPICETIKNGIALPCGTVQSANLSEIETRQLISKPKATPQPWPALSAMLHDPTNSWRLFR